MNIADIQPTTPRLMITFRRDPGGNEQFGFSTAGQIPPLSLIGCLTRVRQTLPTCDHLHHDLSGMGQPQGGAAPALVIAWDAAERSCAWFVTHDIPVDPLVGFLELIGAMLADVQLAAMAQAAQGQMRAAIVGADGRPVQRGVVLGG